MAQLKCSICKRKMGPEFSGEVKFSKGKMVCPGCYKELNKTTDIVVAHEIPITSTLSVGTISAPAVTKEVSIPDPKTTVVIDDAMVKKKKADVAERMKKMRDARGKKVNPKGSPNKEEKVTGIETSTESPEVKAEKKKETVEESSEFFF